MSTDIIGPATLRRIIEEEKVKLMDKVQDEVRKAIPPDRHNLPDFSSMANRGSPSSSRPSEPLPAYGSAARANPGWEREYEHARRYQWNEEESRIRSPESDYETVAFFQAVIDKDQAKLREIEANQHRDGYDRALTSTSGGVGLVTTAFSQQVALLNDRVMKMRSVCTVITSSGNSVAIPRVGTQPIPAVFGEGADMEAGVTDAVIASVTATPNKIGQVLRISTELSQDSPLAVASLLSRLVAEAIGFAEDSNILDGALTDFTDNIFDDATLSATLWDDSAETLATLATKLYQLPLDAIANASWIINIAAAERFAALSGNERQIFLPFSDPPNIVGGAEGGFGLLLGKPVLVFPVALVPVDTGFVGDFSAYTIVSRDELRVVVDPQAFFGTDQVGIHVSRRVDGVMNQATRIRKHPVS